ncbi:predicted protein [Scheffersomyces stipitis CBS 6054]|uniref:GOLD domain-containing protein n=1 Tax=Scheffersomyces stipitis (strain ATCC 58785 / CBS 6054 / NBRC 10063 / NRRL Y-11545) TaxID=322104 RepID=A3LTN4_PICST|nr:predicted protein [Scheffersomyces stipitis CBS 6054]ABN66445.1 predicted protein [Scheffersomyces stipitis CBS 6054]
MSRLLTLSVFMSILFWIATPVAALGLTVPPVKSGDTKNYSSRENLRNCVSYQTVKDDIILVRVKSGTKVASQMLNLNVFDDENNKLRFERDISNEISIMFTNLNNPRNSDFQNEAGVIDQIKRSNIMNEVDMQKEHKKNKYNELINSDKGKSLVYICFDNLYADKSWSYNAESRDVELYVDIKNMETIQQTNYNNFAQYFLSLRQQEIKRNGGDASGSKEFTQEDFEKEVQFLKTELDNVVVNLQNSELILQNLMEAEFRLRDVNEDIFSAYTTVSIVLISCIVLFGLAQTIYFRFYLKKRRLL